MSCYWPPMPQNDNLVARALELVQAEHYGRASDPHLDAAREYAAEQVALAARALVRAVDALPPEQRPIGWDQDPEDASGTPAGTQPAVLAQGQVDALAEAGNRAVNDKNHEDLCACDAWPEKCLSSGSYVQGYWDIGGMDTAIPAVIGLWESMRADLPTGQPAAVKAPDRP